MRVAIPPRLVRPCGPLRRWALLIAAAAALSSCGAAVVGSGPEGIWFREPFIGSGGIEAKARRHCALYGREAVSRGTLDPAPGLTLPVTAFDCR